MKLVNKLVELEDKFWDMSEDSPALLGIAAVICTGVWVGFLSLFCI